MFDNRVILEYLLNRSISKLYCYYFFFQDGYMLFGQRSRVDDQIIQPIESQPGLRRLHPQSYDHKRELKKLNHSILANFLDLLDILIKNPESRKRAEKVDDLTLLFIHMHHLINEFRPHQARETLRVMMEVQNRQRLETAERFQKHLEKVQGLLQSCVSVIPDESDLETKLTIRTDQYDALTYGNGRSEAYRSGVMTPEHSDDESVNSLDRLMCNIIDQINGQ